MYRQYVCKSASRWNRSIKKNGKQSIGRTKGGLRTKIHVCCSSEKYAFVSCISAGNKNDATEVRKLIRSIKSQNKHYLLADRAYEDNETRKVSKEQGFVFVVPPKRNRKNPWEYDKAIYKRRKEVERYFRKLKRFRRIFTRYDKLDAIYISMIKLAMIFDATLM